jgi:secreted trypsin-like serine protease
MTARFLLALIALLAACPAPAMVGGAAPSAEGVGRSVVTIVGSRGNFCSGVTIGRDLVLTAAHCVQPGADYKIVDYGTQPPRLLDVASVTIHPGFSLKTLLGHRATADVALLKLSSALPASRVAAPLGAPVMPISAEARFTVAGMGVTRRGDGSSGGTIRAASLVPTGQPGNLQIRLVDPITRGARDGLGACTGDSGAPVFEDQSGRAVIVGVVSWSTGPNLTAGCGGMTGVTPLSLYRDWIVQTARRLGTQLLP